MSILKVSANYSTSRCPFGATALTPRRSDLVHWASGYNSLAHMGFSLLQHMTVLVSGPGAGILRGRGLP